MKQFYVEKHNELCIYQQVSYSDVVVYYTQL